MNGVLRGAQDDLRGDLDTMSAVLSRALGKLPSVRGASFRGIEASPELLNRFSRLTPGQIVRFRGYTSTSAQVVATIAGDVLIEIEGFSGRSIRRFSIMPDELEVLFDRGATFDVISVGVDTRWGYDVPKIVLRQRFDTAGLEVEMMSETQG